MGAAPDFYMEKKTQLLVVDDEDNAREVIALAARASGFTVVEARDGATALELVEEYRPLVVLTDIHMPRMDGEELASRLLRKYGPDCPQLVVATADHVVADQFKEDPRFFAVLKKPLNLAALLRAVTEALEASGGESGPRGVE